MRNVLVTGDAGFIGFHVASALLRRGDRVVGIDSMSDYYDPALKRARLSQLSQYEQFTHHHFELENAEQLREVVEASKPDLVIHLGAQAGVRYSLENPSAYISSNIVGTFNLLEALRTRPPEHLMLASTSSVYGGNDRLPFAEIHRADHPVSLYAATKKATEDIAHSYAHLWSIPTTCFRFFTVYGPWGRPDMALFKFVRAIRSSTPIDVYGEGKMRRDFTYIDDLVAAILRLTEVPPQLGRVVGTMDSISAVAPFRTVNIAGGTPVGLLAFIAAIEEALGVKAVKRMLEMQPGDVVETSADTTLLAELVGELPATPIAEGVGKFVEWYDGYYPVPGWPAATSEFESQAGGRDGVIHPRTGS